MTIPQPQVPGYEILGPLGTGAHGVVWRALQLEVGREVALKLVPLHHPPDAERFRREVEALSALTHPCVVACHDVGPYPDGVFLALELMAGGDCQQVLEREGPLPPERVAAIIADAARGLQALADAGLVHRDIKPSNLLLDAQGACKVGDLGLTRGYGEGGTSLTRNSTVEGTPAYLAPEQVRGETIDARSDLHALGLTAVALLSGRPPYPEDDLPSLLRRIALGPALDLTSTLPDLHPDLRLALATACDRDPARRYVRPADFAADLEAFRAGRAPAAARALRISAMETSTARPAIAAPTPTAQSSLTLPLTVAAGLLLAGAIIGWHLPTSAKPVTDGDAAAATVRRLIAVRAEERAAITRDSEALSNQIAKVRREQAALADAAVRAREPAPLIERPPRAPVPATDTKPVSRAEALPLPAFVPVETAPVQNLIAPTAPAVPISVPQTVGVRLADGIPDDLRGVATELTLPGGMSNLVGFAVHPTDARQLLIWNHSGQIVRSGDGGASWRIVQFAPLSVFGTPNIGGRASWSAELKRVFIPVAAANLAGWLSVDDGETFRPVPLPWPTDQVDNNLLVPNAERTMLFNGNLVACSSVAGLIDTNTTLYALSPGSSTWKVVKVNLPPIEALLPTAKGLLMVSNTGSARSVSGDLGKTRRILSSAGTSPAWGETDARPRAYSAGEWLTLEPDQDLVKIGPDGQTKQLCRVPAAITVAGIPIVGIALDAQQPGVLYLVRADGLLLSSMDTGQTWRSSRVSALRPRFDALATHPLACVGGRLLILARKQVRSLDLQAARSLFDQPLSTERRR